MKQKKLLVWGVVLACVMFAMDFAINRVLARFLGNSLMLFPLLMTCLLSAAACGILAASAYEKRGLGISSAAVALLCRTISLIDFCSVIVGNGFNSVSWFSLVMQQMYMVVAVLWFLRFILNRPMKTLLLVVTIVGVSLGITIGGVDTLMMMTSFGYGALIITYLFGEAAFWTLLLLAVCGQPKAAAKSLPETAEAFAEPAIEFASEAVPSAEEETVPVRAQETTAPASNALDALERLAKLHERGILTDAEFESKKAELLSKI